MAGGKYDSRKDTKEHIEQVRKNLYKYVGEILDRAIHHDD